MQVSSQIMLISNWSIFTNCVSVIWWDDNSHKHKSVLEISRLMDNHQTCIVSDAYHVTSSVAASFRNQSNYSEATHRRVSLNTKNRRNVWIFTEISIQIFPGQIAQYCIQLSVEAFSIFALMKWKIYIDERMTF